MDSFTENIKSQIENQFPHCVYLIDDYQEHNITARAEDIYPIIKELKSMGFIFLTDLTGNHFPEVENAEFQVVYHIHNLKENHRIRLKVNVPASNPQIPTITDLFSGANWMERETFDFFGIEFIGHPNLKRILNMDDMDYHPMRKEYALEDATRNDKQDSFFGR
jgi:NADH-quinone oxidoreductase subunit C